MDKDTLWLYLANNLSIEVVDDSEPVTCGGEVDGSLGIKVRLKLRNNVDGTWETISEDRCTIG